MNNNYQSPVVIMNNLTTQVVLAASSDPTPGIARYSINDDEF